MLPFSFYSLHHQYNIFVSKWEACKAGLEKVKEAMEGKKVDDKLEKANDPNVKPSERMDAAFEANQAAAKAAEHHVKAEVHTSKHVNS